MSRLYSLLLLIILFLFYACTETEIDEGFEDTAPNSDIQIRDIAISDIKTEDIGPDVFIDIGSDIERTDISIQDAVEDTNIVDEGISDVGDILIEDVIDVQDVELQDEVSIDTGVHKCSYKEVVHTKALGLNITIDLKDYRASRYYVEEEISLIAESDGDTITLFGNGHTINSVDKEYIYDGSKITICLPPYKKGDRITAQLSFIVNSNDELFGLRRWRLNYQESAIGPFNEPYFANYWLFVPQSTYDSSPQYDYNITLENLSMTIKTPDSSWTVYGPFGLKSASDNSYQFEFSTSVPLYSLSFAASNYYNEFKAGTSKSGVEIKGVALKSNLSKAKLAFSSAKTTIDRMEEIIGPYDFGKLLQIVDIPQFGGGMEHTTIIWIGSDIINAQSIEAQYVTAHEVIHHWWGDNLMFADWQHFWLAEGFTEWSTIYEIIPLIADSETAEKIKYYWRNYASDEYYEYGVPLRFSDSDDMMSYFNEVLDQFYKYGSSVVEMILLRIERDFNKNRYEFLSDWFNKYRHKTATTEDLRQFLIDYTSDYNFWESFFNEWVYSTPCPNLMVSNYNYSNGVVSFKIKKLNGIQKLDKLEVHIYTNQGEKTAIARLENVGDEVEIKITTSSTPYHIGIDPDYYYVFKLDFTNWNGPSLNFGKKDYSNNLLPIRRDISKAFIKKYIR